MHGTFPIPIPKVFTCCRTNIHVKFLPLGTIQQASFLASFPGLLHLHFLITCSKAFYTSSV